MKTAYMAGIAICSSIVVGCGGGGAGGISSGGSGGSSNGSSVASFKFVSAFPGFFTNKNGVDLTFGNSSAATATQTTTVINYTGIDLKTECSTSNGKTIFVEVNQQNFIAYPDSKKTIECLRGEFTTVNSMNIEYKNSSNQTIKATKLLNENPQLSLGSSIWQDQANKNHYYRLKASEDGSNYKGCEIINGTEYSTIIWTQGGFNTPNPYVENNGSKGYFIGYGRISFSPTLNLDRITSSPSIPTCR